jgi:hypothetical protein
VGAKHVCHAADRSAGGLCKRITESVDRPGHYVIPGSALWLTLNARLPKDPQHSHQWQAPMTSRRYPIYKIGSRTRVHINPIMSTQPADSKAYRQSSPSLSSGHSNVVDHNAPDVTSPSPPNPRRAAAASGNGNLITVEPLRKHEMQPSYAQDLGLGGVEHGIYGSFINGMSGCAFGSSVLAHNIGRIGRYRWVLWRYSLLPVPQPVPRNRTRIRWASYSIRTIL